MNTELFKGLQKISTTEFDGISAEVCPIDTSRQIQVRVNFDLSTVWCTCAGDAHSLDVIEYNLERRLQELSCKDGLYSEILTVGGDIVRPWVRKARGELKIMQGAFLWLLGDSSAGFSGQEGLDTARKGKVPTMEAQEVRIGILRDLGWRDYQLDAIRKIGGSRCFRGILDAPTGSGKSRCAFGCAYVFGMASGIGGTNKWLYLCHARDVVAQANTTFNELEVMLKAHPGVTQETIPDIRCRTWGLVEPDLLAGPECACGILVDECHGVAARTRASVVGMFKGLWRIGFSATPLDRSDSQNALVIGLLGPVVFKVQPGELIEKKAVSQGDVIFVRF